MRVYRNYMLFVIPLALLACESAEPTAAEPSDGDDDESVVPPNIVVLMTDDQALNTISALGNSVISTPNIDKLVERGVSFMNHYATTAISMASRASVMTGMYEYRTGCNFSQNNLDISDFEESYPVLLREAGYYTGFAGKFGFEVDGGVNVGGVDGYENIPVSMFDEWGGGEGQTDYSTQKNHYMVKYAHDYPHSTRAYGAFSCDFIDNAVESGKPFCLSVSFKAPHRPVDEYDPIFADEYSSTVVDMPASYPVENSDDLLPMQAKLGRQYLSQFVEFGYDTQNSYLKEVRSYYRLIAGVDCAVGMILDKLEQCELSDNTIVIFTSDNGYSLGAHRLGGKELPYDCATKIPLIVYDPSSSSANTRVEALTGNIDIAPTVMEYAGVSAPSNIDGVSLKRLVDDGGGSVRDYLSLMNTYNSPSTFYLSVVSDVAKDGGMKYIYWGYADDMNPSEELFDLANDPDELINLASNSEYADDLERFRATYDMRVNKWKKFCTSRGDYSKYPTIFSRLLPWEERKDCIPWRFWNGYKNLVKEIGYNGDPYDYEAVIQRAVDNRR